MHGWRGDGRSVIVRSGCASAPRATLSHILPDHARSDGHRLRAAWHPGFPVGEQGDKAMTGRAWPELNDEVREIWSQNADHWDGRMGEGNLFHSQLIGPSVERLLGLRPGEEVLEIACGNGQFARRMAELGARVLATDISQRLIEHARARTAERPELAGLVTFDVLDGTSEDELLALGAGRFDAAVCNMGIMDMTELDPLLRALCRLLRPGGRFVFALSHPCFNQPGTRLLVEEYDRDGELVIERAVKVVAYRGTGAKKGLALIGQPRPQWYFTRTLSEIFGSCFAAGFVLDGLEEPAFSDPKPGDRLLGWSEFAEIPPVLAARVRPA